MLDKQLVGKEAPNIVHQNAIWRETIRKEARSQKLYTAYHINPHKKIHNLTGKFLFFNGLEKMTFSQFISTGRTMLSRFFLQNPQKLRKIRHEYLDS
jgi:hypothetical protein